MNNLETNEPKIISLKHSGIAAGLVLGIFAILIGLIMVLIGLIMDCLF